LSHISISTISSNHWTRQREQQTRTRSSIIRSLQSYWRHLKWRI